MNIALGDKSKETDENIEEHDNEDFINKIAEKYAESRRQQKNVSIFAFTATPKHKTLVLFGGRDENDRPIPFHLYSMRQAIEEGFILDVLQNYTTYEFTFNLIKKTLEDPLLKKGKALKTLKSFINLNELNINTKSEIIFEHFAESTSHKIGGKAKAMLVCGSRMEAYQFYNKLNSIVKSTKSKDVLVLIAFSGKLKWDNEELTESKLNGFGEKELPNMFKKDSYKVLVVADKYQTGFDQPLLHTMYVNKKLHGIRAVQTLSRLNRTYPGKEDTFVLDFVNDANEIKESFQPYYERTIATEDVDINHLYRVKDTIEEQNLFTNSDVEEFAKVFLDPKSSFDSKSTQRKMYQITENAYRSYLKLEEEQQEIFKKKLRTFNNLYTYLSQIIPYADIELEKFYIFCKNLYNRLPRKEPGVGYNLNDKIMLKNYEVKVKKDLKIELEKDTDGELSGVSEAGLGKIEEEDVHLSELVTILNNRFGSDYDEADELYFNQIETEMMMDDQVINRAINNPIDLFEYGFNDKFNDILFERMEDNKKIFEKILENEEFGEMVKRFIMNKVYKNIRDNRYHNAKQ